MRSLRVTTSALPWPTWVPCAHGPDLDPPGGEVLGHVERDLGHAVLVGRQRADPEGRVGELAAHRRLDRAAAPAVAEDGFIEAAQLIVAPLSIASTPPIAIADIGIGAADRLPAALGAPPHSPPNSKLFAVHRPADVRPPPVILPLSRSAAISSTPAAEQPQVAIAACWARSCCRCRACRLVSVLRIVLPPPLPEELLISGTFEPPEMYSSDLS